MTGHLMNKALAATVILLVTPVVWAFERYSNWAYARIDKEG